MSSRTSQFPNTLRALRGTGTDQGGIGDALRADVIADIQRPGEARAQDYNYFDDCKAFLRTKGYEFDAAYLRALYRASAISERMRQFGE